VNKIVIHDSNYHMLEGEGEGEGGDG